MFIAFKCKKSFKVAATMQHLLIHNAKAKDIRDRCKS